ncbi:hypothetical protein EV356DRAFT_534481 [Viridothelium virens]|uniref:PA14 domain-containing protein n=1 Tax=Viridothelium virens TaxID=1048519 RepID=A0A6A6H3J1_VIRVR|nr:hypothetical protein EV356DRAFT_534481 [Viridothelium virens]
MRAAIQLLSFVLPFGALAAPATTVPNLPNPVCAAVTALLSLADADPKATPFCSSYLHIGTVTVTKTATYTPPVSSTTAHNTITAPTSTRTSTVTSSITTPYTVIQTATVTVTTTTIATSTGPYICPASSEAKLKARGTTVATPSPTPSYLKGLATTAVSKVCSCLAIPSPTSTATTTSTLVAQTLTTTAYTTTTPVTTATVTVTTTIGQEVDVTNTVTVTSTSTSTNVVPPVPTGLSYYQYDDSFQSFDPADFQSPNYQRAGVIQNIDAVSGPTDGPYNLPGYPPFDIDGIAIVFQGYFVPPTSGTFTFTVEPNDDDHFWLWTADNALGSNWQDGNQDLFHYFANPSESYSANLEAGKLLPVTILWLNAGNPDAVPGPGAIHFDITSPDGTQVEDTTGFFAPVDTCGGSPFSP